MNAYIEHVSLIWAKFHFFNGTKTHFAKSITRTQKLSFSSDFFVEMTRNKYQMPSESISKLTRVFKQQYFVSTSKNHKFVGQKNGCNNTIMGHFFHILPGKVSFGLLITKIYGQIQLLNPKIRSQVKYLGHQG